MWFGISVLFFSANLGQVEKVDYKQLIGNLAAKEGSRSHNGTKVNLLNYELVFVSYDIWFCFFLPYLYVLENYRIFLLPISISSLCIIYSFLC